MGLLTSLWKLTPPSLPINYCPKSWSQLANDLIGGTQVTFLIKEGSSFYNYGPTTPLPENRIFPWLNTTFGRWYNFSSALWLSPMDPMSREPSFRKMWRPANGTPESALWSLDEGSGADPLITAPNDTTGATWAVDHEMDGLFPVGVGNIPGTGTDPVTNPVVTYTLGQTGGEHRHTMSEAEGAAGQHIHAFGKSNNAAGSGGDDAFFRQMSLGTVPTYSGTYISGNNGVITSALTDADLFTLPSGTSAAGVTAVPFDMRPNFRAVWWVKATARKYFTLPA